MDYSQSENAIVAMRERSICECFSFVGTQKSEREYRVCQWDENKSHWVETILLPEEIRNKIKLPDFLEWGDTIEFGGALLARARRKKGVDKLTITTKTSTITNTIEFGKETIMVLAIGRLKDGTIGIFGNTDIIGGTMIMNNEYTAFNSDIMPQLAKLTSIASEFNATSCAGGRAVMARALSDRDVGNKVQSLLDEIVGPTPAISPMVINSQCSAIDNIERQDERIEKVSDRDGKIGGLIDSLHVEHDHKIEEYKKRLQGMTDAEIEREWEMIFGK